MLGPISDFKDTVSVSRAGRGLSGNQSTITGHVSVFSAVKCNIDPMNAKDQRRIFGNFSQKRQSIQWGTEALKHGDRITYAGEVYQLHMEQDDRNRPAWSLIRPMQIGILEIDLRPKA